MKNKLIQGDCLDVMEDIPDGSVDMVCCDLPYGSTCCAWDSIIPFEPLWSQYKRVIRKNGAIVLTGSQPFTTDLINSNREWFKYELIWEKTLASGFPMAKNKPLKKHENVLIFSEGTTTHIGQSQNRMLYNPQMGKGKPYQRKEKSGTKAHNTCFKKRPSHKEYYKINTGERYPNSIIKISNPNNNNIHPTQKPVKLFEYLILTYSNPGDTILDNCAGSGTTAVAAHNTGRNYICIEKDSKIYEKMAKRVKADTAQQMLF